MALRLVRIVVPSDARKRVLRILEEHGSAAVWHREAAEGMAVVETVVSAEGSEPLLDELETSCSNREGFRILLLPLAASIPRIEELWEEDEEEPEEGEGAEEGEEASAPSRISREELYAEVSDITRVSSFYHLMVALSSVVAAVGILQDSPAVIIGAMVIAPLLGPNMGLALATTLGDLELGRRAIISTASGVTVAFSVSLLWGVGVDVDPSGSELLARSRVGYGDIVLALAAGAAGVLSVLRGVAMALVGVMVAVALLPPLVTLGLLLGGGYPGAAVGAFLLVATNVICINLAGVVTFLLKGVRPLSWFEADRARKGTWIAVVLWVVLLAGLAAVIGLVETS